jgi:restriction system protein
MSKHKALAKLVTLRREDAYPNMISLHEFEGGRWDLEHSVPLVVPWTKGACNIDAKLMIVAQDWASEKYLMNPRNRTPWRDTLRSHFGQDPHLHTNRNIRKLLRCFGIKWRCALARLLPQVSGSMVR